MINNSTLAKHFLNTAIALLLAITTSLQVHAGGSHGGPIKTPPKASLIKWMSPDDAYKAFQASPKPVFIDVYTDWCGWCKRMDATTFQDATVAAYINRNFYPVKFNAETKDTVNFLEKQFTNTQAVYVKKLIKDTDSLLTLYKDSVAKSDGADKQRHSQKIAELTSQRSQVSRQARRTSHDFAIDIMNRSMSYPTFVVLFDSLKQNFPIKGFQQPNKLLANLSFFGENAYKNTRNLQGYQTLFLNTFAGTVDYQSRSLPNANAALDQAKTEGKKTILLLTNDQLYTSQLMEKGSFYDPEVQEYLAKHFTYASVEITSQDSIVLNNYAYKNVNGIHQLPVTLMNQKVTFPAMVLLNEKQELVMPIPGFFLPSDLLPALHFLNEEIYKTKETYPAFRARFEKERRSANK